MLTRIESQSNSRIRLVRKLGTRKGRTAEGKYVIEGLNLVRQAVEESLDIVFIMIGNNIVILYSATTESKVMNKTQPFWNI